MRVTATALVAGALLVVIGAGPAAADPARPTNYVSTVRSIEPATQAVSARVVGGDSFLELRVVRGHEATVLGYSDEPYLRVLADGTVEENERSPAVVLNRSRYGRSGSDSTVDEKAEPQWRRVGSGGTFAWHDHRIHWMSSAAPPPQLDGASEGAVFDWTVPVRIDGVDATIRGDLYLERAPSKLPYVALGVVALAVFAVWMRRSRRSVPLVLGACALLACVVSLFDQLSVPAAAGRQLSLAFTPAVAVACAAVAALRPRSKYAGVLRLASAVVLPLWILRRLSVLANSVLPGDVSPVVLRSTVVLAIAAVVAYLFVDAARELRVVPAADDAVSPPG